MIFLKITIKSKQTKKKKIQRSLNEGKITSFELTKNCLDKIKEKKDLNAFITVCEESSLDKARESDKKREKKQKLGKLEGIPLSLKDAFLTENIKTTAASKMLQSFIPPYSSHVTSKLEGEGYILIGKTNMDEYCMGSTNSHSAFGASISPWSDHWSGAPRKLTPGGSSGGFNHSKKKKTNKTKKKIFEFRILCCCFFWNVLWLFWN